MGASAQHVRGEGRLTERKTRGSRMIGEELDVLTAYKYRPVF